MSTRIYIIDFEDSFTYNIANILYPHEKKIEVIPHHIFFEQKLYKLDTPLKIAVILGPGPGHPKEYCKYFNKIKKIMCQGNIYIMGICLGHQIMNKLTGAQIKKASNQLHGQTIKILFKNKKINVQCYNSLGVYIKGVEQKINFYPNGISYQFHPESVGTSENMLFFHDLLKFIKN